MQWKRRLVDVQQSWVKHLLQRTGWCATNMLTYWLIAVLQRIDRRQVRLCSIYMLNFR